MMIKSENMNIQNTKSSLAKLLATENITVEFANVQTAQFDVKNRILVCPQYKDMTNEMYDLFVGHEVSHALYTPSDGHEQYPVKDKNFHSFVNVVEDARIERFIQDKYPGLKKDFYKGYSQLKEKDFFSIKDKDVNSLLLIDRLNLKAKLGTQIDIEFNETEQKFYDAMMTSKTFDEVLKISKDLFEYCGKELEEKEQEGKDVSAYTIKQDENGVEVEQSETSTQEENQEEEKNNMGAGDSTDNDTTETDQEEKADTTSNENSDDEKSDDDSSKTATEDNKNKGKQSDTDEATKPGAKSITDTASQQSLKEQLEDDESKIFDYCDFPKTLDYKKFIVDNATVIKELTQYWAQTNNDYKSILQRNAKKFKDDNQKVVNYLHKEFEMKKAADSYARASESKTGVINTNKLFSYKYNEDLFQKVMTTPDAKNHGMIFYLDWSGSMHDNMKGTIMQLLNLVLFCKKVNIPFSVYAFSSHYRKYSSEFANINNTNAQSKNLNEMIIHPYKFSLLELITSDCKTAQYNQAFECLVALMNIYSHDKRYEGDFCYFDLPSSYYLGQTPLNDAIVCSKYMIQDFQSKHKVQIMNAVFLTDGSSHCLEGKFAIENGTMTAKDVGYTNAVIRDKKSRVEISDLTKGKYYRRADFTKKLYLAVKQVTGANMIGFFVASRRDLDYAYWDAQSCPNMKKAKINYSDDFKKYVKKNKFFASTVSGLDTLFIVQGGKELHVDNSSILDELQSDAKKSQIQSAFKKASKGKLQSRIMLNKFIENIAA